MSSQPLHTVSEVPEEAFPRRRDRRSVVNKMPHLDELQYVDGYLTKDEIAMISPLVALHPICAAGCASPLLEYHLHKGRRLGKTIGVKVERNHLL